ncbi:expressed unknown protein [Seminavis robusta]|uniref:Uncharacterized protein n=1 Tax=Seminavis robusta TaxID=568900 RepID=A0A9N8HTY4_9STRA|nr:expressed unknown protein [Seminavis robusta]|eukprot:Sro1666_g289670.1 n/a (276) ;mRNA; f:5850-6804
MYRGGDSTAISSKPVLASTTITVTSNDKDNANANANIQQLIQVVDVVQLRPLWKWTLRLLAVFAVLSFWEAYTTVGLPFAQAIWELLHSDNSMQKMPDDYLPSSQDIRIARTLAAAGQATLPNQDLPSLPDTLMAVLSLGLYIILHFLAPTWLKLNLAYKPLSPQHATTKGNTKSLLLEALQQQQQPARDIAVLVRVQTIPKKGGEGGRLYTSIRTLSEMKTGEQTDSQKGGTKKKKNMATPTFTFQIGPQSFQWNPSNDKLIPVAVTTTVDSKK